jgi:hypothetical protein
MRKVFLATALVATLGVASMPQAEARYDRNGWLIGGLAAGALLGGAMMAQPARPAPVYSAPPAYYPAPVYVEPEPYYRCRVVNRRIWDPYLGSWVVQQREVCH